VRDVDSSTLQLPRTSVEHSSIKKFRNNATDSTVEYSTITAIFNTNHAPSNLINFDSELDLEVTANVWLNHIEPGGFYNTFLN